MKYLSVLLILLPTPVLADEVGRYQVSANEWGYVVIDTATGQIKLCTVDIVSSIMSQGEIKPTSKCGPWTEE